MLAKDVKHQIRPKTECCTLVGHVLELRRCQNSAQVPFGKGSLHSSRAVGAEKRNCAPTKNAAVLVVTSSAFTMMVVDHRVCICVYGDA